MLAAGPAEKAFLRLAGRFGVGLRGGVAVASGLAAAVGVAPPAVPALVTASVAVLVGWSGCYLALVLAEGQRRALVATDVALTTALCLGHSWLVPASMLTDGSSWVYVVASATVISAAVSGYSVLGAIATVTVAGAHATGLLLAGRSDVSFVLTVALLAQGVVGGVVLALLRRSSRSVDRLLAEQEVVTRDAHVRAAIRADEREHYRLLHDSVSATLTVVSTGGVSRSSPTLRMQAVRDLAVLARIQAAQPPPDGTLGSLEAWLRPSVDATRQTLEVDYQVSDAVVTAQVGSAVADAVTESLANVARHAGTGRARVVASAYGAGIQVEISDDGRGFVPAEVPSHRRGLRESLIGRMHAVGGSATVHSRPGAGTRVVLRWPGD